MKAMILAAGLGKRLRPLTEKTPKPLIPVKGKKLIDYSLDLVRAAGVKDIVINCHYLADQIEAYARHLEGLNVFLSDERNELLETGGGVQKALPYLGSEPFAILNSDVIVRNEGLTSLCILQKNWNPKVMDFLLLLQPKGTAYGYEGNGDFHLMEDGSLKRPEKLELADYIFTGVQIVNPVVFDGIAVAKFSMNILFDKAIKSGRLFGVCHDGQWFHVGTEKALAEVEKILEDQ